MRVLMLASLIAAILPVVVVEAAVPRQIVGAEQDHSLAEADDCAHFFKTTFTAFPAQVHRQEQREFFGSPGQPLRVTASHEGGVSIRGWNRKYTRLVTCRYAAAISTQAAERTLEGVTTSYDAGVIAVAGPAIDAAHAWWVNMILYVPRNATVDVRSGNGGIAIRNMLGQITASATTGGISIAQSSGDYHLSTISGGITLERVQGSVDAVSREGTIALKLEPGTAQSVDARTDQDGQILCTLIDCGAWTADRKRLRLGHGVPGIRISTSAPIIIAPVNN